MTRWQNRDANRGSSGHSFGPDRGDGWSLLSRFGGGNSAQDAQAIQATRFAPIAETDTVVAMIDAARPVDNEHLIYCNRRFLDSFQVG